MSARHSNHLPVFSDNIKISVTRSGLGTQCRLGGVVVPYGDPLHPFSIYISQGKWCGQYYSGTLDVALLGLYC